MWSLRTSDWGVHGVRDTLLCGRRTEVHRGNSSWQADGHERAPDDPSFDRRGEPRGDHFDGEPLPIHAQPES